MLRFLIQKLSPPEVERSIRRLYRLPGFTRRISACPVCGTKPDRVEFNTPLSPLDHCADCGHVFTRLMPGKLILQLMYRDLGYWEQDKAHQGITAIEEGPHWKKFVDARINAMRNGGVLDGSRRKFFEIGCSEGMLLRELGRLGHEALGSELNAPVAQAGMKALGVTIRTGLFEELDLPRGYYDVVASFHTVEHLTNLDHTFSKIVEILKPDGAVFVEVPTGPEEYLNRDHVQFFSEESLRRLMEKYFEFGETIPNRYVTADGKQMGSLYGVGRRPKRGAT